MTAAATVLLLVVLAAWWRPRLLAPRGRAVASPAAWRRRPSPPTTDEWAALLDRMSAEVRTGSSLTAAYGAALRRASPAGALVRPGVAVPELFAANAVRDPDEAVVVHAVTAAHALGGPVAATLDAASALLRERAAIRAEARAYSAQARLSARVLTGVPIAFAAWSMVASRSFRTALLSQLGLISAAVGGVVNLLGWWWMRRLVTKAAR